MKLNVKTSPHSTMDGNYRLKNYVEGKTFKFRLPKEISSCFYALRRHRYLPYYNLMNKLIWKQYK